MGNPPPRNFLLDPILTPWALPALTIAVVWPHRSRRASLAVAAAILFVLASWLMLGRVWIISPGGIFLWPDRCYWYVHERWINGRFAGGLTWEYFWPGTTRQAVELLSLALLLTLVTVSLFRPVSRRFTALVGAGANGYAFWGWAGLMWSDRFWGVGKPPYWPGHLGATMPRASGLEILQGAVLFGLIGYLLSIIIPLRRSRASVAGTSGV
jgi:hypothetical protein